MYKGKFLVPSVEHQGDIDYFSNIIRNAGGEILREDWSGEEDDYAIIFYQCGSSLELTRIIDALEDA